MGFGFWVEDLGHIGFKVYIPGFRVRQTRAAPMQTAVSLGGLGFGIKGLRRRIQGISSRV